MSPLASLIPALGWALLAFLWQGTLVWIATALVLALLRNARPQTRYVAAALALLACLVLPVAGMLRNLPQGVQSIALGNASAALGMGAPTGPLPMALVPMRVGDLLRPYLPLVVTIWALGTALLGLRLAAGLLWVRRLAHRARAVDDALTERMKAMAANLGLQRTVILKCHEATEGPLSFGWWKPVVLLPASLLTHMDPLLVEALLAHELAHIRRYDYLVNLLQSIAEILLFFHPCVWWISHKLRQEREQIADDLAATALGEPRRLAVALKELDAFQFSILNPTQAAQGGHLMTRIRRLIRPEPQPFAWAPALALSLLAVTCVCGLALRAQAPSEVVKKAPKSQTLTRTALKPGVVPIMAVAAVERGAPSVAFLENPSDERTVASLGQRLGGDFLWFRTSSASYAIQDPTTVASLAAAMKANKAESEAAIAPLKSKYPAFSRILEEQMRLRQALNRARAAEIPVVGEIQRLEQELKPLERDIAQAGKAFTDFLEHVRKTTAPLTVAESAFRKRLEEAVAQGTAREVSKL